MRTKSRLQIFIEITTLVRHSYSPITIITYLLMI